MLIKIGYRYASWIVDFPSTEKIDPYGIYAGVYLITCQANQKSYIGSSKNLIERIMSHISALNAKHHCNGPMQKDAREFGLDRFSCRVLILCPPEHRFSWEQAAIYFLQPEYNIATTPLIGFDAKKASILFAEVSSSV